MSSNCNSGTTLLLRIVEEIFPLWEVKDEGREARKNLRAVIEERFGYECDTSFKNFSEAYRALRKIKSEYGLSSSDIDEYVDAGKVYTDAIYEFESQNISDDIPANKALILMILKLLNSFD